MHFLDKLPHVVIRTLVDQKGGVLYECVAKFEHKQVADDFAERLNSRRRVGKTESYSVASISQKDRKVLDRKIKH